MSADTTLDDILNHRLTLEQPRQGFRVAVDTILLAAAVPACAGHRVLDMGCGVGGAMLALAARVSGIQVLGIDIQAELVGLAQANIARNHFEETLTVRLADVKGFMPPDHFDHVMINPPYHDGARHDPSSNIIKRLANTELSGDLREWLDVAERCLKPEGVLTMIHRADRLDDIMRALPTALTVVEVVELIPKQGVPAKRIVLRATKSDHATRTVSMASSVTLHDSDGTYTAAADAILRHMQALPFLRQER